MWIFKGYALYAARKNYVHNQNQSDSYAIIIGSRAFCSALTAFRFLDSIHSR
jgi:hypothetical protein